MNSAKAAAWLRLVLALALLVSLGIAKVLLQAQPAPAPAQTQAQAPVSLSQGELRSAGPESLGVRYAPARPPAALGQPGTEAPAEVLRRWHLQAPHFQGPLAWCPATGKLAFFRDGWVWVTDGEGSRVRTLWFEPDLAAAGRLAWSDDGSLLWIRADGWRRWLSLRLSVQGSR